MSSVRTEIYNLSGIIEKGIIERNRLPKKYRKYLTTSTKDNIYKTILKLNINSIKTERSDNLRGLLVYLCNMQFEYILTLIKIHLENVDIAVEGKTSDEILKLFTRHCTIIDYNGSKATKEVSNFVYSYKNARNQAIHVGQYIEDTKTLAQDTFINYACRKEVTSLMVSDENYKPFIEKYSKMQDVAPAKVLHGDNEVIEYLKILRCVDLLIKDIKIIKDSVVQDYVEYMFVKLAYLRVNLARGLVDIQDEDEFTYEFYKNNCKVGFGKNVNDEVKKLKALACFK